MPHAYTAEQLVEEPAIGLFGELGGQTVSAMEEVFGTEVTLGRGPIRGDQSRMAESMVRHIIQLCCTIQNLRRTRDLLLPRLLSGQVELGGGASSDRRTRCL
jgi:hypothetical protein